MLDTLGLLLLISIAGGWLVRREGVGVLRRAQRELDAGVVPGRQLIDGVLVLAGGALLLTPGFITDCVGLVLLVPPVRAGLRRLVIGRLERRFGGRTYYA